MRASKLAHLTDAALLRRISTLVARGRALTASLIAHLAEFDSRKLYLPAGYPSMHAYCVDALHFSDDAAYRRIRAARAARQFPVIHRALADGRVHLATISVLAPHLSSENVDELLKTCTHRRKADVESMVALRFPGAGGTMPAIPRTTIRALPTAAIELVPGRVPDAALPELDLVAAQAPVGILAARHDGESLTNSMPASEPAATQSSALSPDATAPGAAAPGATVPGATVISPDPEHFVLRVAITARTRQKLSHAQALLSHRVASGDVAQVIDRALDALIERLERRRFAATARPRAKSAVQDPRSSRAVRSNPPNSTRRHVPAHVRRAVWRRDRGRCTFVGEAGHRCEERRHLQFDHIRAFARGGPATEENLRLRCRGHNQLEADRTYGARFMKTKREAGAIHSPGAVASSGRAFSESAPNSP